MATKSRGVWGIVVQNVKLGDEAHWAAVRTPRAQFKKQAYCIEENPESPGHYHLHMFLYFVNPVYKMPMLTAYQDARAGHTLPPPEHDPPFMQGSVSIKKMEGSWEQCTDYITKGKSKKDKHFGEVIEKRKEHYKCCICGAYKHYVFMSYNFQDREGGACYGECARLLEFTAQAMGMTPLDLYIQGRAFRADQIISQGMLHHGDVQEEAVS